MWTVQSVVFTFALYDWSYSKIPRLTLLKGRQVSTIYVLKAWSSTLSMVWNACELVRLFKGAINEKGGIIVSILIVWVKQRHTLLCKEACLDLFIFLLIVSAPPTRVRVWKFIVWLVSGLWTRILIRFWFHAAVTTALVHYTQTNQDGKSCKQ